MKSKIVDLGILYFALMYAGCQGGCLPGAPVAVQGSFDGGVGGTPPPVPANAPAGVLAACANLRGLGCPEGQLGTCENLNTNVLADHLTALGPSGEPPMACVVAAKSGAAVRSCAPTWATACADR